MDGYNALHLAKGVFSFAATMGTARIIRDTLESYSPTVTILDKGLRFCAGVAITGLVNETIKNSAENEFDKTVNLVQEATAKLKDQTEPPQTV